MKLPAWPAVFMLGSTLADKYFKKYPFESSWFKKGAGEIECGLYCGPDGTVRKKCSQSEHFKFSVRNHNLTVASLIFRSVDLLRY